MSTPSSVSIGIELEFTVAQHADKVTQASPKDSRWICDPPSEDHLEDGQGVNPTHFTHSACMMKVSETVAALDLPVACFFPPEPHPQNPVTLNIPRGSILHVEGQRDLRTWNKQPALDSKPSRFDYWTVNREFSITTDLVCNPVKTAPQGYNWIGTEISSPIIVGPSELQKGLPQLKEIMTALRNNIVLWTTSGCGMHVHVGNGGPDLDLDTIKRVVSLVYLLEQPLIAEVCHPIRRTALGGFFISKESSIAKEQGHADAELEKEGAVHIQKLKELTERLKNCNGNLQKFYQAMHRIWSSPSVYALQRGLRKFTQNGGRPPRGGLYVSEYGTIEFRYAESSFDVEFATRWAMLCRHIFGIALRPREEFDEVFYRVFELVTQARVPSWQTMMGAIGFTVHPDKWNERVHKYSEELKDLDDQPILSKIE